MKKGEMRRNSAVFMAVSILYGIGSSFLSEGYVQAYLMELGLSVGQIGLYGTLSSAGAMLSYAAFTFYRPKNGSYLTSVFVCALIMAIFPVIMAMASVLPGRVIWILTGIAVYQFVLGFRASGEYSAVPTLMPRALYGQLSARCGVIGSGLAALVSALSIWVMSGANAMNGYRLLFALAAGAFLLSALAVKAYRPIGNAAAAVRRTLRGRFSWRSAWLLLPHLLRGIASAGFYYFVVASLEKVTLSASGSALIVTVGVAGSMAGCFAFMRLEKQLATGRIVLLANLMCAACAVLTALNGSEAVFFALYFLYMLTANTTAYAIPAGVMYSVSDGELPFISSMRMLMMSGGTSLFLPVFSAMLGAWPAWAVMACAAGVHIAAGVLFRIQYTDRLKGVQTDG